MSQAKLRRPLSAIGIAAAAVTYSLASVSAFAAPAAPDGIWYTKDDESIIRVHPCSKTPDEFCGMLVWLKEPKETDGSLKVDKLNKDPAKRNKPMIGLEILRHMKADTDHWTGKAYNPEDGKLYDITFKVKESNDEADLRGCILGFLCQTETFTRAKEVPGGEPVISDATPTPPTPTPTPKKHKTPK